MQDTALKPNRLKQVGGPGGLESLAPSKGIDLITPDTLARKGLDGL